MLGRVVYRGLGATVARPSQGVTMTGVVAKQLRFYSSDKNDTPSKGLSNKFGERKQSSAGDSSLNELIEKLSLRAKKPTAGLSGNMGLSDLISPENQLKGDVSGFTGAGRMGSQYGRMLNGMEEIDPMRKLILHVHASSNNTILSLTDSTGKVLFNASGGTVGFKKAQRAGFEAAYQATASIAAKVKEKEIPVKKVEIRLKGFGAGREAAFKAVHSVTNWVVCRVVDATPIPFNGCRPKKARRL